MFEPLFAHFGPLPSAALLLALLGLALVSPVRHLVSVAEVGPCLRQRLRRLSQLHALP
jgi:hypothetical protein